MRKKIYFIFDKAYVTLAKPFNSNDRDNKITITIFLFINYFLILI